MSSSATFTNMRVYAADQFRLAPSRTVANTSLYMTFGKVTSWANDSNPDIANTSVATVNQIWQNMIGGKRLFSGDIVHVIPRFDWAANTKYIAYDHTNSNLYDGNTQFYILTSEYNVYKCISNANSSFSTVEPTAINPAAFSETSDGYVWKYMYSVSDGDQLRFTTSQYIPVRALTSDDGSLQWQVQDQAIEGQIDSILLTNGGRDFTDPANVSVTIAGDGESAAATATVNTVSNTISSITVSDYGFGYSYATVSISGGGGADATARAIISPAGGHGSNPVYELGAAYAMVNGSLRNTEQGVFDISNDYRQIALLIDPKKTDSNVSTNLTFAQTHTISTIGSGDYDLDEIVYQGASFDTSFFNGKIVSWDSTNGVVKLINTTGSPTSQSLVGANSSTARFVTNIIEPELTRYSGQILYVNNILPITRAADQTEDFKIVIKF
jgi:hypothetical protein